MGLISLYFVGVAKKVDKVQMPFMMHINWL